MKQAVMWAAFGLVYAAGVNLFAAIVVHANWAYIVASIVAVPCSYLGAHLAHEMSFTERHGPVDTGANSGRTALDEDWEAAQ